MDDNPVIDGNESNPHGPFTAASVRRILTEGVLKQRQVPPGWAALEWLAQSLNRLNATFKFAIETANGSKPQAAKVRSALEVLAAFYDARNIAAQAENDETRHRETILYNSFQTLLSLMESHTFDLPMDGGALMPRLHDWHDIASRIATMFNHAMSLSNGPHEFGLSNEGPIPRFIAAVVPLITGETPAVGAVGKFLKDKARR